MNRYLTASALLGTLALAGSSLAGSSLASAQPAAPAAKPANQCFFVTDWGAWRAPDSRTLYIKVGMDRVYKLDLANECPALLEPNTHLITHVRGTDTICSPVDIDLKVSEGEGFSEPCIVTGMTQLSPAQIAALPKDQRP
ncbi:MAG: hypothetical protein JO303_17460 [Caulobacteraceae bacterium]|nr:hypothetical protein [Caulobacteraceae bacterium]